MSCEEELLSPCTADVDAASSAKPAARFARAAEIRATAAALKEPREAREDSRRLSTGSEAIVSCPIAAVAV